MNGYGSQELLLRRMPRPFEPHISEISFRFESSPSHCSTTLSHRSPIWIRESARPAPKFLSAKESQSVLVLRNGNLNTLIIGFFTLLLLLLRSYLSHYANRFLIYPQTRVPKNVQRAHTHTMERLPWACSFVTKFFNPDFSANQLD